MKRRVQWDEGWLIAAAFVLLLALSLVLWGGRQPRARLVEPVHSALREALELAATIDVNTASAAELEELPGIGEVLAAAIVEYREEFGPFERAEDLLGVRGIGEGKLEGMRPYLRLD